MADLSEQFIVTCFVDILDLLSYCDEKENCTSKPIIESTMYRLEAAVRFMEQVLPVVSECKDDLEEATINLKILFQRWCRKLQELDLRFTPNCTHLAVYSVRPPERCESAGAGRPKFKIEEETLLQLRNLGFTWKDIARLLLVSRWTLWRRVRELDIEMKTGFSDIVNDELDDIVQSFMSMQGCLVGYSMVRGHLRDVGIKIQRNRIRESIIRVDPVNTRLRWATVISR